MREEAALCAGQTVLAASTGDGALAWSSARRMRISDSHENRAATMKEEKSMKSIS